MATTPVTNPQYEELLRQLAQLSLEHQETRERLHAVFNVKAQAPPPQPAPARTPAGPASWEPSAPMLERLAGNSKSLRSFLAAVKVNLMLQPSRFQNDPAKVAFAGALLSGPALAWFATLMTCSDDRLNNWNEFVGLLQDAFGNANEQAHNDFALRTLRQGQRSAAEYLTEFRRLAYGSGYDEYAQCTFLRGGLSEEIKDRLSMQPAPQGLHDLETLVLQLDQPVQERLRKRAEDARRGPRQLPNRHRQDAPLNNPSAVDEPPSMEIDPICRGPLTPQERQRRMRDGLCLYCGGKGRVVRECRERRSPAAVRTISSKNNDDSVSACFGPVQIGSAVLENSSSFVLRLHLSVGDDLVPASALLDSGSSGCFLDSELARANQNPLVRLDSPQPVVLVDGRPSSSGDIMSRTGPLGFRIDDLNDTHDFLVTRIASHDMILGLPWL